MGDVIDFEEYRRRRQQDIGDCDRLRAPNKPQRGTADLQTSLPESRDGTGGKEDRPAD